MVLRWALQRGVWRLPPAEPWVTLRRLLRQAQALQSTLQPWQALPPRKRRVPIPAREATLGRARDAGNPTATNVLPSITSGVLPLLTIERRSVGQVTLDSFANTDLAEVEQIPQE
jgi:hypothetical protein